MADDLRQLDAFLPRIQFGKVVNAARGDPNAGLPQASDNALGGGASKGSDVDTKGFAYLKRDLVRLLGIVCHENQHAQDRVRMCGGITVVMNLCVVDERNPCTFISFSVRATAAQPSRCETAIFFSIPLSSHLTNCLEHAFMGLNSARPIRLN